MEPISLVTGRDYPDTYRGFVEMFPDEAACEAYLTKLRWPQGFVCPACKSNVVPRQSTRGRLVCPCCSHRTTVSAGTIFDKPRTPLTTWFEAAWHVSKDFITHPWNAVSSRLDYVASFQGGYG